MDYFPLFLKLQKQPCLLIGAGEVALRKAELLLNAGASLRIIAPHWHPTLLAFKAAGRLTGELRAYQAGDETGQRLVIAASASRTLNSAIYAACEAQNILVNVVDSLEECRFIVPSIVDRSPLQIAISTAGHAPVLARQVREQLEGLLPHAYGALALLMGKMRPVIKAQINEPSARRRFWQKALKSAAVEEALAGNVQAAEQNLLAQLTQLNKPEQGSENTPEQGAVYLVGAGPGNPDLLTFRALHLMQRADVVLYDNLVSPAIVELVRRDARRIYVGKIADKHPLPQEEINRLMVKLAQEGQEVLRLKGGDPFIFGRGGEEIEELVEAGIRFEVVPGITSAAGASCYAGIPLTHRDYAQSVTFVTGHRRAGEVELDWPRLVSESETVVVYMGVQQAEIICQKLIAHGRKAETLVAIIERATTPKQRVVTGTLANLADKIAEYEIKPPALIIIGGVVALHEKLRWRNNQ